MTHRFVFASILAGLAIAVAACGQSVPATDSASSGSSVGSGSLGSGSIGSSAPSDSPTSTASHEPLPTGLGSIAAEADPQDTGPSRGLSSPPGDSSVVPGSGVGQDPATGGEDAVTATGAATPTARESAGAATTKSTPETATTAASTATAATTTTAPGTRPGHDTLASADWLTADGKVLLRTDAPTDPHVNTALCAYLFGAPADVAKRTLLPGTPLLLPVSGVKESPSGGFVTCAYALDDGPVVALEVGHSDDPWSQGHTVIVQDGDVHAVVSYVPNYQGERMPDAEARTWLQGVLGVVDY